MPALIRAVVDGARLAGRVQPTLSAGTLVLRPWTAADVPVLVAAYDDPAIQQWHARSMTEVEAEEWVSSRTARWAAASGVDWAVTADDVVIGRIGLRTLDLSGGSAEVAYWVLPAARGRRVAPRALDSLTAWAFGQIGLHRLVLKHSTRNLASCAVAERAGYALEGTARSETLHPDGWHDMHWHAALRPLSLG